ncbi:hypothetical protein Sste5344_006687 [Sporothrix stenoceras]
MHYSVEDQTPSLAHLSNRFYAKVTIHFYVPPKKFILRSLDACTESKNMARKAAYEAEALVVERSLSKNSAGNIDTGEDAEKRRHLEDLKSGPQRCAERDAKRDAEKDAAMEGGCCANRKRSLKRKRDPETQKALDKFAVEIKERIREKRFTSTGRRSGAAGNGGPAPPPRKGPPCDAEKVFNVMPSIEEIFPSRFNKAGKLNLLEMPVRDQRTLNQRPHYYV